MAQPSFDPARWRDIYIDNFQDARQERLFVSSVGFLLTFGITRAVTHYLRRHSRPVVDDTKLQRRHVHHLVWGILLLLGIGYLWLIDVGADRDRHRLTSAATSLGYGVGSALTLDEFALWLNLRDVYWASEGRESVDAVVFVAAFLSVGLVGGRFWRAAGGELGRLFPSGG